MSVLITSDLHFTNNPLDEYRWKLFPWLSDQVEENQIKELFILGDLTEKKDCHDSKLLNRLVFELNNLAEKVRIIILMGNHDFTDRNSPFFLFLDFHKNITFLNKPHSLTTSIGHCYFIPYMGIKNYEELEKLLSDVPRCAYDYLFLHETIIGAQVSSGIFLNEGIPSGWFSEIKHKIYSGHIHIPQEVGPVEYIGSPYNVYFGDSYRGRSVFIEKVKAPHKNLYFDGITRHSLKVNSIEELESIEMFSGDQAKVTFTLHRGEIFQWKILRQKVQELFDKRKVTLCSLKMVPQASANMIALSKENNVKESNTDILKRFSQLEGLRRSFVRYGKELMDIHD